MPVTINGSGGVTGVTTITGSGLDLISSTTIGSAVTSVAVSNCFSSTYTNYRIIISGGAASATSDGSFTLGASTSGYYNALIYNGYGASTPAGAAVSNAASTGTVFAYSANGYNLDMTIFQPFATARTSFVYSSSTVAAASNRWSGGGFHDVAASYTGITFATQGGHTLTGGTIKVYGIKD